MTGLTQEVLAGELSVTRSAVAQWEMADGTAPSVENMIALAQRSGLCFEYLATGRGERVLGPPDEAAIAVNRAPQMPLSDQQRRLLERFETLSSRQKNALLELLESSAFGHRRRS